RCAGRRGTCGSTVDSEASSTKVDQDDNETKRSTVMYKANAYSAASATAPLAPITISRRDPGERDVQIDILFCGICHSDYHQVRSEWKGSIPTVYPIVPGHEIVGRV